MQPVVAFARMIEGPFVGSPLATDTLAQVGSGGMVTNFIAAMFVPGCGRISCAPAEPTTNKSVERQNAVHNNRFRVLITPHPLFKVVALARLISDMSARMPPRGELFCGVFIHSVI